MNLSIKSNNKQTACWAWWLGYIFKQYIERQIKVELRWLGDMIQGGPAISRGFWEQVDLPPASWYVSMWAPPPPNGIKRNEQIKKSLLRADI